MASQLTDKQLRALPKGDHAVGPDGLRVNVHASGTTFFYRYKSSDGKLRRAPIGRYAEEDAPRTLAEAEAAGRYSLKVARSALDRLKDVRASGVDPREYQLAKVRAAHAEHQEATQEAEEAGYTFKKLCRDWLKARKPRWGIRMQREAARIVDAEILPRWKDKPVRDWRRRDVVDARDAIALRGGVASNRALWAMKNIGAFAVEREELDANPAASVERSYNERKNRTKRNLKRRELAVLVKGLPEASIRADYRDALHLVLLTGCRNNEACGAHRDEVDLEAGTWTIPEERTKNGHAHKVMLSRQAAALLKRLIANAPTSGLLFPKPTSRGPKPKSSGPITNNSLSRATRELCVALEMAPWTPHALRRTLTTQLGEMDPPVPPEVADGRMLNHQPEGVRAHYDYAQRDRPAAVAWQRWADFLDALTVSNVVALEA